MTDTLDFLVNDINEPIKIKDYLRVFLGFSSALLTKVKCGGVFINGECVHMSACVRCGDKITVTLPRESSDGITGKDIPLQILYEDDFILAVSKPIGMPTHPCRGNSLPTLAEAVMNYFGDSFVFRAISRLDKDTSGIVLIAKNAYSAAVLGRAMKMGEIEKEYTALVLGVTDPHGIIEAPIERLCADSIKRGVTPDGKYAKTEYERIRITKDGNSLIRVKLYTGRTHQIRVHMAHIGHALVGDALYSDAGRDEIYKLHCDKIAFDFLGKRIALSCPPPF